MICIERISTGMWKANCYVVYRKYATSCLVIDPGGDPKVISQAIRTCGKDVAAFVATHGHYDHVDAAGELQSEFGASVWIGASDRRLLGQMNLYRRLFDGLPPAALPSMIDTFDGDGKLSFAELHIDIIACPGHTSGSVSFHIEDAIFTGDTLMKGKVGDHHFPESDEPALIESISRLLRFPPATRIFPGHGPPTFVADEYKRNHSDPTA